MIPNMAYLHALEQLNYSIHFYLYVLCSKPFRDTVGRLLTCRRQSHSEDFTDIQRGQIRAEKQKVNDEEYPPIENTVLKHLSVLKVNEN